MSKLLQQSMEEMIANQNEEAITARINESIAVINRLQPQLNDYISIADNTFLEEEIKRVSSLGEGLLMGVPISIKDNIMMKEMPMTAASKMLANFTNPTFDATVVTRLKEQGAVIMGKTNLDEFAMGSSGDTSFYGPTKNPYNLACVPGGSSSGSAASVASGGVKASLGTDTGGSVRQPASFTNSVGMKPTYGLVSRFGVTAFSSSLDQVGVITKTVADNARVLSAIAGRDELDTTSHESENIMYHEHLDAPLEGKKIAIIAEYLEAITHPEIHQMIEEAIKVYEALGATVEKVSLPVIEHVVPTYYIIASCEASSNLAGFDGMHFGHRTEKALTDVGEIMKQSRSEGFGPEVKKRIALGTYFLGQASYEDYYLKATKMRRLITNEFDKIFETYDIVLGATAPVIPKRFEAKDDDINDDYLNDLCTIPANLVGLPAISIPGGFSAEGLPIGLQLMGRAFSEATLYQFAQAFESQTKYCEKLAVTEEEQ